MNIIEKVCGKIKVQPDVRKSVAEDAGRFDGEIIPGKREWRTTKNGHKIVVDLVNGEIVWGHPKVLRSIRDKDDAFQEGGREFPIKKPVSPFPAPDKWTPQLKAAVEFHDHYRNRVFAGTPNYKIAFKGEQGGWKWDDYEQTVECNKLTADYAIKKFLAAGIGARLPLETAIKATISYMYLHSPKMENMRSFVASLQERAKRYCPELEKVYPEFFDRDFAEGMELRHKIDEGAKSAAERRAREETKGAA